jgi:hypothetical protein
MVLDQLRDEYPLAERWSDPEVFLDTVNVCGVSVLVAGLSVRSDTGETAFGSAGSLRESPVERAYFELIERIGVLAAPTREGALVGLRTQTGQEVGTIGCDVLFPRSPEPDRWRYARSNGVAVASSWREACMRAEWELVERDRIVRSWLGERSPLRVIGPIVSMPQKLTASYLIEAYVFESSAATNIEVAGVFGFPKSAEAPLVYGFAARPTQERAIAAAATECVQRMAFLWGEAIPSARPDPTPTPDFHQEFFLWPPAHARLRRWLAGDHCEWGREIIHSSSARHRERRFVDLTPRELNSKLHVAKALPDGELPLVFGSGGPGVLQMLPDSLGIHPIC